MGSPPYLSIKLGVEGTPGTSAKRIESYWPGGLVPALVMTLRRALILEPGTIPVSW